MNRSRAGVAAGVAFLMTLALGAAFVHQVETRRREALRRRAGELAQDHARSLERELAGPLAAAHAAAAVLRQAGRIPSFARLAEDLQRQHALVASLALAPDGVVRETYPPGPDALDRELLAEGEPAAAAAAARASRQLVLSGPLPMPGTGPRLLGVLPVLLPAPGAEERLWGFVVVAIRLHELLGASHLERLAEQGFHHDLRAATSRRPVTLSRSTERELDQPVAAEIDVPGGGWRLSLAPQTGWRSRRTLAAEAVLVFVAGLLIAGSLHRLLREPERLRHEVETRSRRLSDARRELKQEADQRLAAEERLLHDARHDLLTSLPNRFDFVDRVQRELDRARESGEPGFAVLFLDVDRFKHVNDSLGPARADRVLALLAQRLETSLRPGDVVARVGGDEFAGLLRDVGDTEEAAGVAERLLKDARRPFELGGEQVLLEASIGLALASASYSRAEDLLRDADTALHAAKTAGRARQAVFEAGMRERAVALQRLESELRQAVEREEFEVHYQPIISLDTGSVTSCEALVRWRHPRRGLVSPMEFMPLAEEKGLVIFIDRWVLGVAARQTRAWLEQATAPAGFAVSVNLSGRELAQPRLVEQVRDALLAAGLAPSALKLELTESSLVENVQAAEEVLGRFRDMGVKLLIDDFGTGYSSLSYLQRFPFDTVKIDQSFVKTMDREPRNREIVNTIVALAGKLGMSVLAEGVETAEQLADLRRVGCHYAQGYYLARPLPSEAMAKLLASRPRW